MADYFTVAVRTGDAGMGGLSLLLLETGMRGIAVRKMETQFDSAHSTTFVTLENVRVPVANLIGEENNGFMALMTNFNHERWISCVVFSPPNLAPFLFFKGAFFFWRELYFFFAENRITNS